MMMQFKCTARRVAPRFSTRNGARVLVLGLWVSGFLGAELVAAGAWMRGPQHAYTKVSVSGLVGTDEIDQRGDRQAMAFGGRFQEATLGVYSEVGLASWLDLVIAGAAKRVEFANDLGTDESTLGLSDLHLGARVGAWVFGPVRVASQWSLKLPAGYARADMPPLGSGRLDLDGRLVVSASLYPQPGYVTAELGRRFRDEMADEVPYLAEVGWQAGQTWLRLTAQGVESLAEVPPGADGELALSVREEDFLKLGLGAAIALDGDTALEFGYWQLVLGKNTILSRELQLGVSVTR